MAIAVTCAACDKAFKVKDELGGKKIKCPQCKEIMTVPGLKATAAAGVRSSAVKAGKSEPRKKAPPPEEEEEETAQDQDDEGEEEEQSKKKKKKKKKKKGGMLIWLLAGGGVAVIAIAALIFFLTGGFGASSQPQAKAKNPPEPPPEQKEEPPEQAAPKPTDKARKHPPNVISGVARRLEITEVRNCLRQIGLMYISYSSEFGRSPSKLADLKLPGKLEDPVKKEWINIIWNANLRNVPAGASATVLAYETDADVYGLRVVLMVDGTIHEVNPEEYKKLPKVQGN